MQMQRWGNIGELGPMRCDKLFAYQVCSLSPEAICPLSAKQIVEQTPRAFCL